ncbi:MAG TPA: hypothetical protein PLL06_20510 [Acidobacteriota bacterium]|nr:hypothetical protein [Acidobacteriota bacterium]
MVQTMQELVDQIYRETRLMVEITPQTNDLRFLPLGMRSFYAFSDGLSIPFANIYPIHYFKEHLITNTYPVWFEIGDDSSLGGYFCGLVSQEDCYFFRLTLLQRSMIFQNLNRNFLIYKALSLMPTEALPKKLRCVHWR